MCSILTLDHHWAVQPRLSTAVWLLASASFRMIYQCAHVDGRLLSVDKHGLKQAMLPSDFVITDLRSTPRVSASLSSLLRYHTPVFTQKIVHICMWPERRSHSRKSRTWANGISWSAEADKETEHLRMIVYLNRWRVAQRAGLIPRAPRSPSFFRNESAKKTQAPRTQIFVNFSPPDFPLF